MYYTESGQVAAVLPSTTPVGSGQVTVSFNGSTGSFPINVVQSNVAMYTLGQTGSGDAIVTLTDNSVVLPDNAPNPGDVVTFWANGLGPVPYDETLPAAGGDMTSVPLEVFVGGQPANVLYRGRSPCCVSLDQVNVALPTSISSGCVVSVVLRIGSLVSNTTTMPIASAGRVCTPTNPAISQSDVLRLTPKTSLNVGIISLERSISRSGTLDPLQGILKGFAGPGSLVLDEILDVPAPGSCAVTYDFAGNNAFTAFPVTNLNAGSALTVTGANGGTTLPNQGDGLYEPDKGSQFLDPGSYTVSATGGSDVSAFQVAVTVPPPLRGCTGVEAIPSIATRE